MKKELGLVCWTGHTVNRYRKKLRQRYGPGASGSVSHWM